MRSTGFLAAILLAATSVDAAPKAKIVRSVKAENASLLKVADLPPGAFLLEVTGDKITLSGPYTVLNLGPVPPGPTPPTPPVPTVPTASLTASPTKISAGQSATLTWKAGGTATTAQLMDRVVPLTGTQTVTPAETTTYTLFSMDGSKPVAMAQATVTVGAPTPPPEANPYPVPSPEWQAATGQIRAVKMSRADATALARMYGLAASQAAAGTIPTTTALRAYIVSEGGKLGLKGKYARLPEAVEKVLAERLGNAVRPVEQADTAAFSAMAWAVWEAGR